MKCPICGSGIPVNLNKRSVNCKFCNCEFEVVKKHRKGSPQIGWAFLGGLVLGFLLGWPASRAAIAATARMTMEEFERWLAERARRE